MSLNEILKHARMGTARRNARLAKHLRRSRGSTPEACLRFKLKSLAACEWLDALIVNPSGQSDDGATVGCDLFLGLGFGFALGYIR